MVTKRPALTVSQWLASVPAERKDAINAVRDAVNEHLPQGYEETVDWGMLAWVVPLATLPNTHNGHPLMLAALGAHTKRMSIYLMSVYSDPKIRRAFETAYKKTGKKLDMGGSWVLFDLHDAFHPRVVERFDDAASLTALHSFARLPNGHVLATFQSDGPNNEVALDATPSASSRRAC
jgi:hypothetical protein